MNHETVNDKALTLDVMAAGPALRSMDAISDTSRRIGLVEAAGIATDHARQARESGNQDGARCLIELADLLHKKSHEAAAPEPIRRERRPIDERRTCQDIDAGRLHDATRE